MLCSRTASLLPLLLLPSFIASTASTTSPGNQTDAVEEAIIMARDALSRARCWAQASMAHGSAWVDCMQLYEDSELRIGRLTGEYDPSDARTWLSAAMTSHRSCIDGLRERNAPAEAVAEAEQSKVALLLGRALAMHASPAQRNHETSDRCPILNSTAHAAEMLVSWDASADAADIVVAKDGSGTYNTINEAIAAVGQWQNGRNRRVVIYIKSGTYEEHVSIDRNKMNVMLVGDGIDNTIITGTRSVPDGYTTFRSATFGVSGDGFWARDITFENTAGPEKHQAVALRVDSDRAVFYRCSVKGYQDTLFVHSQRQFFRDCDIYGTVDFIFGNAAAVLQNCNIIVRRPMGYQSNMVTAQGRDDPNQDTGISVHGSRVMPAQDFEAVKGSFKSYLGRPWKEYSRVLFLKTDLDGLIHPEGWARWSGDFALDTLYYGEYMNTGDGAANDKRVQWPGFHLLSDEDEAGKFTVESFIQGQSWIPESGVPFWGGL